MGLDHGSQEELPWQNKLCHTTFSNTLETWMRFKFIQHTRHLRQNQDEGTVNLLVVVTSFTFFISFTPLKHGCDLAEWLGRLTANAKVATVLGSCKENGRGITGC